jgi:hypothetical protein
MTDNNGWPGKPGVPMNPERDGWHWVQTSSGELVAYLWRSAGECAGGTWPAKWVYDLDEYWPPHEGTYLGPGAWDANPWVWVVAFERVKP